MMLFRVALETALLPIPEALFLIMAFLEQSLIIEYYVSGEILLALIVLLFAGLLAQFAVFLYSLIHKWIVHGRFVPGIYPMW